MSEQSTAIADPRYYSHNPESCAGLVGRSHMTLQYRDIFIEGISPGNLAE
jgi:hypothetical protein